MVKLRFDKAGIHMRQAAIVLATNQDPWAEHIVCSLEDYHSLGWLHFNYPNHKIAIMKDEFGSLKQLEGPLEPTFNIHHILIRPSTDVPDGWVMLDNDRKIR